MKKTPKMGNVKLDRTGVRVGSRKWFASKNWTIKRTTWNDHYPDVVVIKSEEGDNIVMVQKSGTCEGHFDVDMNLSNVTFIGDCLDMDLYLYVKKVIDDITTDDQEIAETLK